MKEKLTNKQILLMEKIKNKWIGKLNSCPKLDKKKAKKFINYLYNLTNFKNPKIIFLDSPLALEFACNMLNESQVRSQVWSQVESQVRSQVWSQVWSQKSKFYDFAYYGSIWDYGWISFYDFFEKIGIKNEKFNEFKKLFDCRIYDMIQQDKVCFVCGMPNYILRDNNQRLHSLEKSSIRWKDGFELYYINGVNFKKELWEKVVSKKLPAIEILKLENIEQRYIALKLYGAENLLKELNTVLIDGKTEKGNELYKLDNIIPNKSIKMLKYNCPSTNRLYVKFVPFNFEKADEAQSWSFQISLKEYYKIEQES